MRGVLVLAALAAAAPAAAQPYVGEGDALSIEEFLR